METESSTVTVQTAEPPVPIKFVNNDFLLSSSEDQIFFMFPLEETEGCNVA